MKTSGVEAASAAQEPSERHAIEQRVQAIVARITRVPAERIGPTTDLRADLNVDSLQGLQIVAAIENEFGVTVPTDEMDMYSSIERITETLEKLTAPAPRPVAVPGPPA